MDQSIIAPVVPVLPKKSFPKWPLIAVVSFLLGIASVLLYQRFLPTRTVPVAPSLSVDQTAGWQVFSGKEISLRYPQDWTVSEEYSDYFSGNIVMLNNSAKTVSVEITPSGQPYGFAGPAKMQKILMKVSVGDQTYDVTEAIVDNRAAFVDFPANIGSLKYYILFGTGYPVNDDQKASIDDYNQEKNNILQILTTFKFTGGSQTCQYNGKTYQDGEIFPDKCNSCSCDSGQIACTAMACED